MPSACTKIFSYAGGGGAQPVILTFPGDTSGTWSIAAAMIGLKIIFDVGCGSSFETATVGAGQNGMLAADACKLSLCQFSLDSVRKVTDVLPGSYLGASEFDLEVLLDRHDELNVVQGIPAIHVGGTSVPLQHDIVVGDIAEDRVERGERVGHFGFSLLEG
jgi:hypothetical protein